MLMFFHRLTKAKMTDYNIALIQYCFHTILLQVCREKILQYCQVAYYLEIIFQGFNITRYNSAEILYLQETILSGYNIVSWKNCISSILHLVIWNHLGNIATDNIESSAFFPPGNIEPWKYCQNAIYPGRILRRFSPFQNNLNYRIALHCEDDKRYKKWWQWLYLVVLHKTFRIYRNIETILRM